MGQFLPTRELTVIRGAPLNSRPFILTPAKGRVKFFLHRVWGNFYGPLAAANFSALSEAFKNWRAKTAKTQRKTREELIEEEK